MKIIQRPLIVVLTILTAGLVLSACGSLASDITPPPDYTPQAAVKPVMGGKVALPLVPPDPNQGKAIYQEKCQPCHGNSGMGDGPQAAKLPNVPAAIGSADVARAARPIDWFSIVTNGNLPNMMPGFSSSLDDRQRWDVVSYAISLSIPKDELTAGKSTYTEQCQSCHGVTGKGDGPQAPQGQMHDWTTPDLLVNYSTQQLHDVIASGTQAGMPAYQGKLDDVLVWAAADYTRSLSFAALAPASEQAQAPAATAEATQPAETPAAAQAAGTAQPEGTQAAEGTATTTVTITGSVVHAGGKPVPAGTKVQLLGFDQMTPALTLNGEVKSDGSFKFENVESPANRVFLAQVTYNNETFNSDILHGSDMAGQKEGKLTVNVYDTSTDTSALSADRMHVFFDFSKDGLVQVGELFIISNPTDKLIVADKPGDPVLKFELPQGATNLSFQDGDLGGRYIKTDNGFADTMSIPPSAGGYQVLFAYDLPYDRNLDVNLSIPLPVQAAVIIGPSGGIKLKSDQLQDAGQQTMQDVNVHLYTAANLAAGSTLKVNLSGKAGQNTLAQSSMTGVIVGSVALVMAIGLIVFWYIKRRRDVTPAFAGPELEEAEDEKESVESLLDAIVALDDRYQSGDISKEAYDERRAELKEKLRQARDVEAGKGA